VNVALNGIPVPVVGGVLFAVAAAVVGLVAVTNALGREFFLLAETDEAP
jgi:hypothetical protein